MHDFVSVIMPSYNTAKYIAASIASVQRQTYQSWELIIVDDCSTDHTDAVVTPFLSDTRIRYLKNERNSGAAVSRNRALREAKGKWIAFLDSDDLWVPEKLEKQITPEHIGVKVENLSFGYTEEPVLQDTSLDIRPGEFVAIIGESGIGKTTLIRLMMSFMSNYEGGITY